MSIRDRRSLAFDGEVLMRNWCQLNHIEPPEVVLNDGTAGEFGVCAYYRNSVIHLWPEACATMGVAGRAWSWPGYSVDRTPYGVIQHELGHHVDRAHGPRPGILSMVWREETQDLPLTSYCENSNEWFAEMFRLFVTNPSLLYQLRPKTYEKLKARFKFNTEWRDWRDVLSGSPRHIKAAENKIAKASKPSRFTPAQARLV